MAKIMGVGDLAIFKVIDVDPSMKIEIAPEKANCVCCEVAESFRCRIQKSRGLSAGPGDDKPAQSKLDVNISSGKMAAFGSTGK